jgi:ankyrin repeat protein
MEDFEYKPIDLKERSFRLLQLFKGDLGPIQCELFHAKVYDTEDALEYEALSYTWGGSYKSHEIEVNGGNLEVTENLFKALHHLRYHHQDRILWIDAICIDQDNNKELGHQVQQMGSIYKGAEQVIIWLGQATSDTDLAFNYMQTLEMQSLNYACNNWKNSDERWRFLWSNVLLSLKDVHKDARRRGLADLLSRSWFERVWILQEVANARSARIICGTKSVSARMFAVAPVLEDVVPNVHCQAVLDIMPGSPRKYSWWDGTRDLRTILHKFQRSQASDPRDNIYALLGISTDRYQNTVLVPDYDKSLEDVIRDSIAYFLRPYDWVDLIIDMPQWTVHEFLSNVISLESNVLLWAAEHGDESIVKLLLKTNLVDKDQIRQMPLSWASRNGNETEVKLLLEIENVNEVDKDMRTSLSWAADNGHEAVVKLLLETGKVNVDSRDRNGRTPLLWAATNGHEAVVELLLKTGKVDVNLGDLHERTPLSWAAMNGHEAVVKLLLETGKVNVDSRDMYGRTPLSLAAENGHEAVVKLLLETGKVNVDSRDRNGRTPLLWAAVKGDEAVVKLLLKTGKVNVDSRDMYGRTPLSWAAVRGHEAVVKLPLETGKVNFDSRDWREQTPLSSAAENGHEAVVKLLLKTGKVNVDSRHIYGRTPLSLAAENGHKAVVKLLLETGKVNVDSRDQLG